MNFELTEALAYWESVKGSRAMHGEQIAEQPATGVDEWPDSLPCLMVADLQWRTDGDNNANRHTFSTLATKLSGGEQRTDWTVPDSYRHPENMVSLQSVTADIASQIISGMKLQPDRLIQAWFDARCTAPAQTPAPVVAANDGPAPLNNIVHSTKTRRDIVAPAIELAQSECRNQNDTAEVWGALQVLAQDEHPPFQGSMPEGLKYTVNGDNVRYFTRDALDKRLHPEKRGAPGKRR